MRAIKVANAVLTCMCFARVSVAACGSMTATIVILQVHGGKKCAFTRNRFCVHLQRRVVGAAATHNIKSDVQTCRTQMQ
jgi:hypothetical protein